MCLSNCSRYGIMFQSKHHGGLRSVVCRELTLHGINRVQWDSKKRSSGSLVEMLTDCSVVGGGLWGDDGKVAMSKIGSGRAPSDCSGGIALINLCHIFNLAPELLDLLAVSSLLIVEACCPSLTNLLPCVQMIAKPDIICLVETWLQCEDVLDSEIRIPNYPIMRLDRNRHDGGVALYIHNSILYNVLLCGPACLKLLCCVIV